MQTIESMFVNGFNRYMVECELKIQKDTEEYVDSFNRYMVECEFLHHQ